MQPARKLSRPAWKGGLSIRVSSSVEVKHGLGARRWFSTTSDSAAAGGTGSDVDSFPIPPGSRPLGTQENLFAPRQYLLNEGPPFPSLAHMCSVTLDAHDGVPVSKEELHGALTWLIARHPMLSRRVAGSGFPSGYLDEVTMKMVRADDPDPLRFEPMKGVTAGDVADMVLEEIELKDGKVRDDLETAWQRHFAHDLDRRSFDISRGPLWAVRLLRIPGSGRCILLFSFNHAIDDQASVHLLLNDLLDRLELVRSQPRNEGDAINPAILGAQPQPLPLPESMETSVLGDDSANQYRQLGPLAAPGYILGKTAEGLQNAFVVPLDAKRKSERLPLERESVPVFRTLDEKLVSALRRRGKHEYGVSLSAVLASAAVLATSDLLQEQVDEEGSGTKMRAYKLLQALDMRNYGTDRGDSVSCQAGSMDLMLRVRGRAGERLLRMKEEQRGESASVDDEFWAVAREAQRQTASFTANGAGPRDAVGVFDWGMRVAEMNNLVRLEAESTSSFGRAYSCGVSNAGVFQRRNSDVDKGSASQNFVVSAMQFAVSHARTGSTFQLSCVTVEGRLNLCFHPAAPLVTREQSNEYADRFLRLLEAVSSRAPLASSLPTSLEAAVVREKQNKTRQNKREKAGVFGAPALDLLGIGAGLTMVAAAYTMHGSAWTDFFDTLAEMKANMLQDSSTYANEGAALREFGAVRNFWILFAAAHPLLTPILWISEVLHASPGPRIGELLPFTFAALNVVVLAALARVPRLGTLVNSFLVALFVGAVGEGLAGESAAGGKLAGYNLALNDGGLKGCPTYEQVRQPSMAGFDVERYQGRWYENAFHDWTQFTEVYDTTLDIELNKDKTKWLDDFGLKGPAPRGSPRSWDKSPVANGAHYFLYGKLDPKNPNSGVLQESGFGVTFPNYIIDVQLAPEDSSAEEKKLPYEEAIQFQCLERGGVRVFEGINFLSRRPTLSAERLSAMHERARAAGLDPYGSSPDQMHVVDHTDPATWTPIDNTWQRFWDAIGLPKLLALIESSTHSQFEGIDEDRVQ